MKSFTMLIGSVHHPTAGIALENIPCRPCYYMRIFIKDRFVDERIITRHMAAQILKGTRSAYGPDLLYQIVR